jgi:hypothetical protein
MSDQNEKLACNPIWFLELSANNPLRTEETVEKPQQSPLLQRNSE